MHQAYNTFPAPVVSSRQSLSSHYAPYSPRNSQTTTRSSNTEFKGSTNPSEDWTKISDLAERRRIQNRIAQRNYRKKLKRRLEDLERRAQSRSISPNGEDTDGRSTRESSTEQANASMTSTIATPTTPPSVSAVSSAVSSPSTISSSPVSSTYDYTTPTYTTTSPTLYPSQYKTSGSLAYSSSISPSTTYVSSPLDYSQSPSSGYVYAFDQVQPTQTDLSVIDPSFILPQPSSSNRIPGVMRTGGMYDFDNSVNSYFLNSYDIQDPYFPAGGISSSYYNLDHMGPPSLAPLLNTHASTHYSASQRN